MGATPYKPISFGKEPVLAGKINILANNIQWVYENMPRTKYAYSGVAKTSGIKILSGNLWVAANKKATQTGKVQFNSYFSVGCKPCIITQVNATPQHRYMTAVRNLNGTSVQADHTGFQVVITASEIDPKRSKMNYSMYINYIAVGW